MVAEQGNMVAMQANSAHRLMESKLVARGVSRDRAVTVTAGSTGVRIPLEGRLSSSSESWLELSDSPFRNLLVRLEAFFAPATVLARPSLAGFFYDVLCIPSACLDF